MKYSLYIFICLFFLCFMGIASATDHYVSTIGDNSSDGHSIGNAFRNVSYGVTQLSAGDTLFVVNGTYLDEQIIFNQDGTAENWITLTTYNGTPIIDGVNNSLSTTHYGLDFPSGNTVQYINVSDLTFVNFYQGAYIRAADFINLENITVYNTSNTAVYWIDSSDCTLKNSTVHDFGWNGVMVQSNYEDVSNITIDNNSIYESPGTSGGSAHNLVDIYTYGDYYIDHIAITNNILYNTTSSQSAFFQHGTYPFMDYINFSNNVVYNTWGVRVSYLRNSVVSGNTIYDNTDYGIMSVTTPVQGNTTFYDNVVYDTDTGYEIHLYLNATDPDTTLTNDSSDYYRFDLARAWVINPYLQAYQLRGNGDGRFTLQYTDGTIFTENGAASAYYYPDRSEYNSSSAETVTIAAYNITVMPDSGYGKDVVVNTDLVDDVSNITVNVSESDVTITMTFLVDNASDTYNLSVDRVYNQNAVSDSDSIVTFPYLGFPTTTPIDFEVTWASESAAPSPTITSYTPETPIISYEGDNQTFSITVDQIVNVTWYINSVEMFNETNVTTSSYSNNTTLEGTYNVTAYVENLNGSLQQVWDWTVKVPDRIPLSIFMSIGAAIVILLGSSLYFVGIPAIFTSLLGGMLAFINSQIAVNGSLVQNIGGFDSSGNVVQGTTVLEIPALSYLFLFVGLILIGLTIYHISKELKYIKDSKLIQVEF